MDYLEYIYTRNREIQENTKILNTRHDLDFLEIAKCEWCCKSFPSLNRGEEHPYFEVHHGLAFCDHDCYAGYAEEELSDLTLEEKFELLLEG